MDTVPISTSVTARLAMKKFVGCRICRSTTKLTKTKRFPKVVITMQMAKQTAMKIVSKVPNGAGQHSGPQATPNVPGKIYPLKCHKKFLKFMWFLRTLLQVSQERDIKVQD